jgi:hypothetical protein
MADGLNQGEGVSSSGHTNKYEGANPLISQEMESQ